MNKVICDVCGTDYPETAAQCPICGCARADGGQTSAGNTVPGEEERAYTYVKGGRFSKSNVRKRLKAGQGQEVKMPEPDYDEDEDEDEEYDDDEQEGGSNWGLITIVILLLLAIIAVSSYIAIVHFGLGSPKETTPAGTTGSPYSTTGSQNVSEGNRVPCTGLTLTDSGIILEKLDSAWQLNFSVEPGDTTDVLTFRSSDESVAVVDANGRVTAVGPGEATITVTCGDFVVECDVECDFEADPTVPSNPTDPTDPTDPSQPSEPDDTVVLELNRTDFTLDKNNSTWKLYSGELDATEITWTSKNETVATVKDGVVTAVGPGRTQIIAEYNGQIASCWVSVSKDFVSEPAPTEPEDPTAPSGDPTEPTEVYTLMVNGDISPYGDENNASVTMYIGESFTLTVENSMGARMEVTWTISDEGICSVDGRKVLGLAKGKVTLTTTYEGQTFTCEVIVREQTSQT